MKLLGAFEISNETFTETFAKLACCTKLSKGNTKKKEQVKDATVPIPHQEARTKLGWELWGWVAENLLPVFPLKALASI